MLKDYIGKLGTRNLFYLMINEPSWWYKIYSLGLIAIIKKFKITLTN